MAFGPGKYDNLCTDVRVKTQATGVLLIVIGGKAGTGFSCQADLQTTATLPDVLEQVAAQIRRDGIAG